ncbi:ComF family protein [Gimibacter soli]|uniref:ComF family protein n=1 Tax=Gimibacter soli TaxID=3024400 RepID=A0AAE9XN98_9PROT|nr:ComF family protein [Gimibacter soli]WCL54158.1 ComF family protein [Gimibacter soli]
MIAQSRAALRRLADLLMPPRCPACGDVIGAHGGLCATCWGRVGRIDGPVCACCGHPFDTALPGVHLPGSLCAACLAARPRFDWVRAACAYDGLARHMVLALKHGDGLDGAMAMARLMKTALDTQDCGHAIEVIIPVPLHGKRLFRRRYNQSHVLAKALGQLTGLPVMPQLLHRVRATESQGGLGRKARFRNVKGAFRVVEGGAAALKGRHVLLVDDVLTTGATVSACAGALKRAGAASVGVLTFARVDPTRVGRMTDNITLSSTDL